MLRIHRFRNDFFRRRQFHSQRKRRPFPDAIRFRVQMTAMHLRKRIGDRESQTKATMPSRRRAIRLAKTIEDMRQKLRGNADTRVDNGKLRVCTVELSCDAHLATSIRELDGVRNEVPTNLP